jgi:hypothetical protein
VKGILALVAEGLGQVGADNPTGTNRTNCEWRTLGDGKASYLEIDQNAAALMAVFAGIGWAVASIIYYLPVSSSTRATAAAVRDHALFAMVLAGTGAALRQLAEFILNQAAAFAKIGNNLPSHTLMYDFNFNSALIAGSVLAWIAGLLAIGPSIPVIGTILSFVLGVVYAPGTAILAGIMVMSAMNAAGYFILHNSMMLIFPIGMALFAAPGKLAKGLGAFLISLSLVSYIALPILPWTVASVTSVAAGGSIDPKSLKEVVEKICDMSSSNPTVAGFFALVWPWEWYDKIIKWLIMVATSSFLLALTVAAARALSQSLGGVSANL